jgi:hypothetical protein
MAGFEQRTAALERIAVALLALVRDLTEVIPHLGTKPSASSRLDAIGRRAEHLRTELEQHGAD